MGSVVGNDGAVEEGVFVGTERPWRGQFLAVAKKQMRLAGPIICANVLLFSHQLISIVFVGHLGELALAGASMATSFASIASLALLFGMSSALETFCGQAFGAKQYHMLGVYMQRAMLIVTLLSIPMAFVLAYAGKILLAFRQDREISLEAGAYARWLIPSLFAYGLLNCLLRFLQTQNVVFPTMISTGITTLLHLPICWLLVFKFGLGSKGAALANGISYWVNVVLLASYIKIFSTCKETWRGFSNEALHDISKYVRLAVPSALMICVELWAFEMTVLLSGRLPNPKLQTSVISICYTTNTSIFMISSGFGAAVSVGVSNGLGAGHSKVARLAVCATLSMAMAVSISLGLCMILARNVWGRIYSNEEGVVKYMAKMMPILAASTSLDSIQCVFAGTLRGSGWQKIGAWVNLGAYYIVGVPSGIIMAFIFHIEDMGLWLGITCALFVQDMLFLVIILRMNWEKEAMKARDRISASTLP